MCQKRSELGKSDILNGYNALSLRKKVLESTYRCYRSSKTLFTAFYRAWLRAPTLLFALMYYLACSEVGIRDLINSDKLSTFGDF
jgi:hypothetical protein